MRLSSGQLQESYGKLQRRVFCTHTSLEMLKGDEFVVLRARCRISQLKDLSPRSLIDRAIPSTLSHFKGSVANLIKVPYFTLPR